MATSVLLNQCSGFSTKAISKWEYLKLGLEFSGVNGSGTDGSSCYFCYSPTESTQSLAVKTSRVQVELGYDCVISHRNSSHFFLFITPDILRSSAHIMDIIGGLLFRDVDRFIICPPLTDHTVFIQELQEALKYLRIVSTDLVLTAFSSSESAESFLVKCISLVTVRDILRQYKFDHRELSTDMTTAFANLASLDPSLSILASINAISEDLINAAVESSKPDLKNTNQEEWEIAVQAMYNRAPPPKKLLSIFSPDDKKKSLRSRKSMRSYADDEDEEMVEVVPEVEPQPVLVIEDWLQCEKCSKWRIADPQLLAEFEDKPFYCSEVAKTCDDMSDDLISKTC